MTLNNNDIAAQVFDVNAHTFEATALAVFRFQYEHNSLYQQYCRSLHIDLPAVDNIKKIPFLPIQFFKTKKVCTTSFEPEIIFESSGTTGSINSRHFVKETALYTQSFLKSFELFYGDPANLCIIGLLPSYLEKGASSLVYMVNELIKRSGHPGSGFYLYEYEKLRTVLLQNEKLQQPVLLIGVTYALLDFAEEELLQLSNTTIMETGGMKGRRHELTREEVHWQLVQQLGVHEIHSEYGMTELLSQAYSPGNGLFRCPPWMKIIMRAEDDPFDLTTAARIEKKYQAGVINIIDLANIYSCAFIATDDVGKLYTDESFEVTGRLDSSDVRGCGLMIL